MNCRTIHLYTKGDNGLTYIANRSHLIYSSHVTLSDAKKIVFSSVKDERIASRSPTGIEENEEEYITEG